MNEMETARNSADMNRQDSEQDLAARIDELQAALAEETARRIRAENALEHEREIFSQRIEERTVKLAAANAGLARAAQANDAFFASVSHELRSPLNAILNLAEMLEEQTHGSLNEAQARTVRGIAESGRQLLGRINDIIDYSRIGAGKFELNADFTPIPILCQTVMKQIEEPARKKGLAVNVSIDPQLRMIWADPRRLKQALMALLNNAVKFTPQGGKIGLIVRGEQETRLVRLSVWDTGIGIAEERIAHLIKPFVQLDNSLSRRFEGAGLGLALAFRIVEMHGGGIFIQSMEGRGSQFTITLPWQTTPDKSGESAIPVNQPPAAGEPILSQPVVRLKRMLTEFGIEAVDERVDEDTPRRLFESSPPVDIVVIDQELIALDRTIIQRIRQPESHAELPVIVLTREDMPTIPALYAGYVEYLGYPFSPYELRSAIRRVSPRGTASLQHRVAVLTSQPAKTSEEQSVEVLLADSSETSIRQITNGMTANGFHVRHAYSAKEVMEQAQMGPSPDLLVLDLLLLGMDPLDLLTRLRSDPRTARLPVIVVSALEVQGERERVMAAGARAFFTKPLPMAAFLEAAHSAARAD